MRLLEAMLKDVRRFTVEVCGATVPDGPQMLGGRFSAKLDHLTEELEEFRVAANWAAQADAMVDLIYVAMGALIEMGVTPGSVFNAVHDANMRKVPGVKPTRPDDEFDAVKPDGWEPPYIEAAAIPLSVLRKLSPVFIECAELRVTRDDYNQIEGGLPSYFPLGHGSYFQMVHTKATRLRSLVNIGEIDVQDKVRDTLLDTINYCTYWVEAMDRGDEL